MVACEPSRRLKMLEEYFKEKTTLARLRSAPTAPYLDDFAAALRADGYRRLTIIGYLRATWHFGAWMQQQQLTVADITDDVVDGFAGHRKACVACGVTEVSTSKLSPAFATS
jgi:hypothetical protein